MLCQCWLYFFHWINIDKMSNILVLYQCQFKTCCYNVTLTSYQWLYQHWTLNILLRCCKSTHTRRGQVCDALGSLRTKSHLDVGPMGSHWVYYKGESGGFPEVQAVVNLVSPSCPWFILALKVLQLCTNHLVLVLCRPVWVNEACQFFLVPS
jgi:hypothetical protein